MSDDDALGPPPNRRCSCEPEHSSGRSKSGSIVALNLGASATACGGPAAERPVC